MMNAAVVLCVDSSHSQEDVVFGQEPISFAACGLFAAALS